MEETEEERDKRYQVLFRALDHKRTGLVNLNEFIKQYRLANHPLKDKAAITELFESFDLNNDNIIDYEDFKKYLTIAEFQIKTGFQMLDSDQDGKLNKEDLIRYFQRQLHIDPNDREIDQFFQNLDNKNDGIVTYDEFRDFLLFMPRLNGSRIKTAFQIFNNDNLDYTNSEGDVTVINDFLKGFGYFLSGGLSGVVSRTTTAPFDRIKVFLIARTDLTSTLIHSSKVPIPKTAKLKSPIVKAATSLYRQGGLRLFYVGNGLNVLKVFPESAMKYGSFELAKRFFCRVENVSDPGELSKLSTYLSGGIAGVFAQLTVYPVDTLKYRIQCLQLDSKLQGTPLLITTAKQMYHEGGVHIFYRGIIAGIMGIFPYLALDLGTFSSIKKWYLHKESILQKIPEEDVKLPNHIVLSMGAISGTFGATMVYPINLIRTRLQLQGTFAHPHTYNGFFDCMRLTLAREGYIGLYKGLTPNLLKVAPLVSISYLCYENLKNLIGLN